MPDISPLMPMHQDPLLVQLCGHTWYMVTWLCYWYWNGQWSCMKQCYIFFNRISILFHWWVLCPTLFYCHISQQTVQFQIGNYMLIIIGMLIFWRFWLELRFKKCCTNFIHGHQRYIPYVITLRCSRARNLIVRYGYTNLKINCQGLFLGGFR